jgi:molecular chaperone GrpE
MRVLEVMRAVQRAPRPRFPFLISPELEAQATQGIAGRRLDDRQEEPVGAFFAGLLPVLDELEGVRRLLLETGEEEWQRGITILYEKLLDHCAASGLRPSAQAGEPFDPELHEALAAVGAPGVREGCVSEVVQQGWRFRDKVLRFARVVVAKNGEPDQAE